MKKITKAQIKKLNAITAALEALQNSPEFQGNPEAKEKVGRAKDAALYALRFIERSSGSREKLFGNSSVEAYLPPLENYPTSPLKVG